MQSMYAATASENALSLSISAVALSHLQRQSYDQILIESPDYNAQPADFAGKL